jgi:hypothetical protein
MMYKPIKTLTPNILRIIRGVFFPLFQIPRKAFTPYIAMPCTALLHATSLGLPLAHHIHV